MKILKDYLNNVGSGDENFYLAQVKLYMYKDYQKYTFYFDIDTQTQKEAVESILENQLQGRVGIEDVDWNTSLQDEDCLLLWDFTNKSGTYKSWLGNTVEWNLRG